MEAAWRYARSSAVAGCGGSSGGSSRPAAHAEPDAYEKMAAWRYTITCTSLSEALFNVLLPMHSRGKRNVRNYSDMLVTVTQVT